MRFCVGILFTLCSAVAMAQEPSATGEDPQWHFGYELFQMLLEERGLSTESSLEAALAAPGESVIVMIGDLSRISQGTWFGLRRFAEQGGRVLLASDGPRDVGGFQAGPVTSNVAADRYQGFSDCLRIRNISPSRAIGTGVTELITNRAGWLSLPQDGAMTWHVVARLPGKCLPRQSAEQPLVIVGSGEQPGSGTVIMLADQSLFTNGMLWHGDNAILAIQVSEALCPEGRNKLVFLSDGQVLASYRDSPLLQERLNTPEPESAGTETPREPELEALLRQANAVIQSVQDSNIVNAALMKRPRNVRRSLYLRSVLLTFCAVAGAFLLWQLAQSPAVWPNRQPYRVMQTAWRNHFLRPDHTTEYGPPLETLARDLCTELSGATAPNDWMRILKATSPAVQAASLTKSQRRTLESVLELAVWGCRGHISRRRFRQLGRRMQNLRQLQPLPEPGT